MAKLTYEDKKEIVRLYFEEHFGYRTIAKRFNVCKSNITKIVREYEIHGEESLKQRKQKKYDSNFKLKIIHKVLAGQSKTSIGIEYRIQRSMIGDWLQKYHELGYDGLKDKPKGRPSNMKKLTKKIDSHDKDSIIKQKDERILELEAEVEALKKLRALVLQRNEQQTKKKQ